MFSNINGHVYWITWAEYALYVVKAFRYISKVRKVYYSNKMLALKIEAREKC